MELCSKIKEIYDSGKYAQNDNYYGYFKWDVKSEEKDFLFMDNLLRRIIPSAAHFWEFTNNNEIRYGSDWNYGNDMPSFEGVTYISIDDFCNLLNEYIQDHPEELDLWAFDC